MAPRIGCVPVDQASSGQRSTAPTTPPASKATAMSQISVGTITQLISNGATANAVIVLSNTAAEVDAAADNLLVGEYASISSP